MAFEESDIFVNNSSTGKALTFVVAGTMYTMSYASINKLKKGEYKAFKLTKIVPDEQVQKEEEEV